MFSVFTEVAIFGDFISVIITRCIALMFSLSSFQIFIEDLMKAISYFCIDEFLQLIIMHLVLQETQDESFRPIFKHTC